jgi:predicted nucleic acid-binding protein
MIIGFDKRGSNSALVVDAALSGTFAGIINGVVIQEVADFFRPRLGRNRTYLLIELLKRRLVIKDRHAYAASLDDWRGLIKEKDLDHLATVKRFGIPYLVAFDRDYEPFPEYRTPREFVEMLGLKPRGSPF